MVFLHCSICPPYGEIKKFWNTSLVPIQWAKPHDATKMPQLLCVKLEDPKNFTSQALRRSRAVIHLGMLKSWITYLDGKLARFSIVLRDIGRRPAI